MAIRNEDDDPGQAQRVEKAGAATKTARPRRASGTTSTTATAATAQKLLAAVGYDPGPVDGIIGPQSRRAIEAFQAAAGLAVDGKATPSLLARLNEAAASKAPPEAPSLRTEIGADGVMREIDFVPEFGKAGTPRQSTIPEAQVGVETSAIELVVDAGLPPTEADIVFTSIDDRGTPGELNQFVLNAFDLGPTALPGRAELEPGFAIMGPGARRARIVFVVTVADGAETATLLPRNLPGVLDALATDGRTRDTVLWLPLMGTGKGGLDLDESLVVTIGAIVDSDNLQEHPPRRILISAPASTPEDRVERLAELASRALEKGRFSRRFNLSTATGPDAAASAPELAVLTVARPYFHNDQAAKSDALNVRAQATIFAKLIAAREVALPLSIGLFGNWGSGKSYFMNLVRDEVEALVTGEDPADEKSTYMRRVAQIEFNAWHYVDTNLWASLAIRIFDGLAAQFRRRSGDTPADLRARLRATMESSSDARTEAEKKQQEAQKEREKAAVALDELRAARREQRRTYDRLRFVRLLRSDGVQRQNIERIKAIAADFGLSEEIRTVEDAHRLAEQLRALHGQGRGVMQAIARQFADWRSAGVALAVIGGFISVFIGISAAFPDPSVYIGQVLAAVSGAVAWAGNRLARIGKGVELLEAVQAALAGLKADEGEAAEERALREGIEAADARIRTAETQIAEADRRIAEAEAELQRINAGGLVYDFLEARGTDPAYSKELGVISTIRRDFNGLRELLEDWNRNYEADSALPPIERIVLYIDDLDRCHPDKVVEVLQAVHLLLAFDLFVVIVAVDPRWLERSLYRAYVPELATRDLDGMEARHLSEFSPQNYLEKIFQIPFSLAAMSEDGYVRLIDDLVVTRGEFRARSIATPPADAPPAQGEAAPMPDRPEPAADADVDVDVDVDVDAVTDGGTPMAAQPAASAGRRETAAERRPSGDEEVLFNDWEQAFLQALHPFVPTPRLAKRMINIYRLIRVGALETPWRDAFFAHDGDYRAVLLLLAINVGHPRFAGPLLRRLAATAGEEELRALLAPAASNERPAPARPSPDLARIGEEIGLVRRHLDEHNRAHPGEVPLTVADEAAIYARWAPEVGRFSFHWNLE